MKVSIKTLNIPLNGALSGLRQFLATESPLKLKKNAFYFILKVPFVLKIFKFLSCLFGHVSERLDSVCENPYKFPYQHCKAFE